MWCLLELLSLAASPGASPLTAAACSASSPGRHLPGLFLDEGCQSLGGLRCLLLFCKCANLSQLPKSCDLFSCRAWRAELIDLGPDGGDHGLTRLASFRGLLPQLGSFLLGQVPVVGPSLGLSFYARFEFGKLRLQFHDGFELVFAAHATPPGEAPPKLSPLLLAHILESFSHLGSLLLRHVLESAATPLRPFTGLGLSKSGQYDCNQYYSD